MSPSHTDVYNNLHHVCVEINNLLSTARNLKHDNTSPFQRWSEQLAVQRSITRGSDTSSRRAQTGSSSTLRSSSWRASPRGPYHRIRHIHPSLREAAWSQASWHLSRWQNRGIHTGTSSSHQRAGWSLHQFAHRWENGTDTHDAGAHQQGTHLALGHNVQVARHCDEHIGKCRGYREQTTRSRDLRQKHRSETRDFLVQVYNIYIYRIVDARSIFRPYSNRTDILQVSSQTAEASRCLQPQWHAGGQHSYATKLVEDRTGGHRLWILFLQLQGLRRGQPLSRMAVRLHVGGLSILHREIGLRTHQRAKGKTRLGGWGELKVNRIWVRNPIQIYFSILSATSRHFFFIYKKT